MAENTTKIYYSSSAALVINISVGRRVIDAGGVSKIVDQKVAEFTPLGDGYGRLITDDPDVQKKLDALCLQPGSGVFDAAEYNRRTTPAEVRVKMLERENQRIIEEHNRLLAMLERDGKLGGKHQSK